MTGSAFGGILASNYKNSKFNAKKQARSSI